MNRQARSCQGAITSDHGISFVIVSHNSWDFLDALLPTIPASIGGIPYEVIVVDSGSTSDPPAPLLTRMNVAGRFIKSENKGFGAANNLGALSAKYDTLFLLNPDTKLAPACSSRLLAALDECGDEWIVGPSIYLPNGSRQASAFRLPAPSSDIAQATLISWIGRLTGGCLHQERRRKECGYLSGAAFMMRSVQFIRLGGFDERFFLYHEETDLFARARKLGMYALHCPEARITHWGGGSTGWGDFAIRHSYRSFFLYRQTHYGKWGLCLARMAVLQEMCLKTAVLSVLCVIRPAYSGRRALYKRLMHEIRAHGLPLPA